MSDERVVSGSPPKVVSRALLALAIIGLASLTACERKTESRVTDAFPEPIRPTDTCAVDGMLLTNHPGPKGLIVNRDGTRLLYCDVRELFEALHDPEQSHRVAKAFAQPMDGRDWSGFTDGWVESAGLVYVLGSRKFGHMGPTLVPFRERAAAERFTAEYGGRLVAADELNAEAMAAYARTVHETLRRMDMSGGPAGTTPHRARDTPHAHDEKHGARSN